MSFIICLSSSLQAYGYEFKFINDFCFGFHHLGIKILDKCHFFKHSIFRGIVLFFQLKSQQINMQLFIFLKIKHSIFRAIEFSDKKMIFFIILGSIYLIIIPIIFDLFHN